MANIELASFDNTGSGRPYKETTSNTKSANITVQQTKVTSSISGKSLEQQNFRIRLKKSFMIHDKKKTKTRCKGVRKKWRNHCLQRHENPYIADIKSVLRFLEGMYKKGCLYIVVCAAGSALFSVVIIGGYDKLMQVCLSIYDLLLDRRC